MTMQSDAPLLAFFLRSLRLPRLRWPEMPPAAVETDEDFRSRRAYLDEVMLRAPEAFNSDWDVQVFLSTMPRGF